MTLEEAPNASDTNYSHCAGCNRECHYRIIPLCTRCILREYRKGQALRKKKSVRQHHDYGLSHD